MSLTHYRGAYPEALWEVLRMSYDRGISVQSDFARHFAHSLALAASLGFITTIEPDGNGYNGRWRITASGLYALGNKELLQ